MSLPFKSGQIIAQKYRVERVLGSGGMGVVVAAKHLVLGERVAIKFLREDRSSNPQAVARFIREGRAAARIRSEHVARVFDVGTLATGEPYIVMEYLAGQDLNTTLKNEGPMAIETAIDLLLQATLALAVAHTRGVIHRDLKPANLFVTRGPDGSPTLKVIDFGLSTGGLFTPSDVTESDLTKSAVTMGTPLYMSPEQMRSARDVDARGDIWALGAILYCLLTREPPFPGASLLEIHERILAGPPSLLTLRPEAPVELDQIIRRCLQKDPADRWADVAGLAAALAPFGPAQAGFMAERVARILTSTEATAESAPPSGEDGVADTESTNEARKSPWADSYLREPGELPSSTERSTPSIALTSPRADHLVEPAAPPRPRRGRGWMITLAIFGVSGAGAVMAFAVRPPDSTLSASLGDAAASQPPVVPTPGRPSAALPLVTSASATPPITSSPAPPPRAASVKSIAVPTTTGVAVASHPRAPAVASAGVAPRKVHDALADP